MSILRRKIVVEVQDIVAEAMGVYSMPEFIDEVEVQKFCAPCGHHVVTGICRIAGSNDQARYAARKGCGWASKDGVKGLMTDEGFKPLSS